MKPITLDVLKEMQAISLEARLLHAVMQLLRERALESIGVEDDGYLADKVQELVDVEGVDFYDVASQLAVMAANRDFDEAALA